MPLDNYGIRNSKTRHNVTKNHLTRINYDQQYTAYNLAR